MTYDPRTTHQWGWDLGMHLSGVIWELSSLDGFCLCILPAGLTWLLHHHASFVTIILEID
jgi:hypothetical protein